VLLADSVGLTLFVVETLTPAERLAYVLHDMFSVGFEEIGAILERSPEAARQLASRGRRRIRGADALPQADLAAEQRVVQAFLAAARDGDLNALVAGRSTPRSDGRSQPLGNRSAVFLARVMFVADGVPKMSSS
jgi:hypothetical protein